MGFHDEICFEVLLFSTYFYRISCDAR